MSKKTSDLEQKSDAVQAVIVADSFGSEFLPLSNDIPLVCVKYKDDAIDITVIILILDPITSW